MRSYGYGSYHGQSKFRTFLKIVIVSLIIVLLLLVGAFFWLQQYIVYSADGVRLELPFLQDRDPSPTPPLVVTTPSSTPVIITPAPTPEPEPVWYRAVSVPNELLSNGGLSALWAGTDGAVDAYTGGAEGAVPILTMKGPDGKLEYVSDLQLAKDLKTSASDPARNGDIRAASALGPAAYVSCFLDDTVPYSRNKLALRTSAGNWRYPGSIRYLSPAVDDARQYITGVCAELGGLGFSELILDHTAFPTEGTLTSIVAGERYDSATFEATVTGFYAQVSAALAPYPELKLSVITDKTVLTGGVNPTSGQTLAALAQYADRIYVRLDTGETPVAYWDQLSTAGFANPEEQLIVILDAPPAGPVDYGWAVLPQ